MNEPNQKIESMLRSLYNSDSAEGFSCRVMQRIANETVESTSNEPSRVRRWRRASLRATACLVTLVGLALLFLWWRNDEAWRAIVGSDPAALAVGANVLELPEAELAARQLLKSDWLSNDFVLFTGSLDNPQGRGDRRTVDLKVDRVIRGDAGDGRIVAKDELFSCQGSMTASSVYPLGQPLLCWLTREEGKWKLVDLEVLTPELSQLLNAVTGDRQAELLRPLITPQGLDLKTTEIVKLVASPEQVTPLLKEMVRETPSLLEPYKGASGPSYDSDWQQRMTLVSHRLAPALEILGRFTGYQDAELVDLILPCYPPLLDPGGDYLRFNLNYCLQRVCSAAQREDGTTSLSPSQIAAVREVLLQEIDGVRDTKSLAANTACSALGFLADSEVVTALLHKQNERPIHAFHEPIASALFQIAWGKHATDSDKERIRSAWIATLSSFDEQGDHFEDDHIEDDVTEKLTQRFANYIAGYLYQVDISVSDLRALRDLHSKTQVLWLREILWRFSRQRKPSPPNLDPKSKAKFTIDKETLIVEFSMDAPADPVTIRRLEEWDGPTTAKLTRSSRVLEIVSMLDEAELDRLEVSDTPLSHDMMVAIGELRSLRFVSLDHCGPCEPVGILGNYLLRRLESLEIKATPLVSDDGEGITKIAAFSTIKSLTLEEVGPLTDWHLARLQRLTNLTSITIDSRDVTSDGIEQLVESLPKLETIVLPQISIRQSLRDNLQRRAIHYLFKTEANSSE